MMDEDSQQRIVSGAGSLNVGDEVSSSATSSASASIPQLTTVIDTLQQSLSSKASAKDKKEIVDEAIQDITTYAESKGLDHPGLLNVGDLIFSSKLGIPSKRKLVKALIPRTTVPVQFGIKAVAMLNSTERSSYTDNRSLQQLMLKWIIIVYDLIDNKEKLHTLYGVLYLYLHYETLRAEICHLLFIMTTKEDILPFRIRKLLKLQQSVGQEPGIHALLGCYKMHCPHLVSFAPTRSTRKSWFPKVDTAWRLRVFTFQQDGVDSLVQGVGTSTITNADRRKGKRMRLDPTTPRVSTSMSTVMGGGDVFGAGEVVDFDSLVKHIDNVTLPSRLASVLDTHHSFLQHLVLYTPDATALHRLGYWLSVTLGQFSDFRKHGETLEQWTVLLNKVVEFCSFVQTTLPGVDRFLIEFLSRWNGVDYRTQIFALIELMPPRPFEVLYQEILRPIYSLYVSASVATRRAILNCLVNIVRRYVRVDWKKFYSSQRHQQGKTSEPEPDDELFPMQYANYMRTIFDILDFVDSTCSVATMLDKNNLVIYDQLVTFYELTTSLNSKFDLPLTIIPSHGVTYNCLLIPSMAVVSRFCGVLDKMVDEINAIKDLDPDSILKTTEAHDGLENIDYFNFYMQDFTATLFRQSILQPDPKYGSILFDAPMYARQLANQDGDDGEQHSGTQDAMARKTEELNALRTSFRNSIVDVTTGIINEDSYGGCLDMTQLFAGFSFRYLDGMRKKAGAKAGHVKLKLSQINQNLKYRSHYLKWLKQRNADGIHDFLFAHVKKLKEYL